MSTIQPRDGFSLIEIVVAMLMLSVGILAMAGSTGHILRQIQAADLRTERMSAVRDVAEGVRSTAWDEIVNTCNSSTFTRGAYQVTCRVQVASDNPRVVQIVSQGPGFAHGRLVETVTDTFAVTVVKPQ